MQRPAELQGNCLAGLECSHLVLVGPYLRNGPALHRALSHVEAVLPFALLVLAKQSKAELRSRAAQVFAQSARNI